MHDNFTFATEGSKYIGGDCTCEHASPISQSKRILFSALFDEMHPLMRFVSP